MRPISRYRAWRRRSTHILPPLNELRLSRWEAILYGAVVGGFGFLAGREVQDSLRRPR